MYCLGVQKRDNSLSHRTYEGLRVYVAAWHAYIGLLMKTRECIPRVLVGALI